MDFLKYLISLKFFLISLNFWLIISLTLVNDVELNRESERTAFFIYNFVYHWINLGIIFFIIFYLSIPYMCKYYSPKCNEFDIVGLVFVLKEKENVYLYMFIVIYLFMFYILINEIYLHNSQILYWYSFSFYIVMVFLISDNLFLCYHLLSFFVASIKLFTEKVVAISKVFKKKNLIYTLDIAYMIYLGLLIYFYSFIGDHKLEYKLDYKLIANNYFLYAAFLIAYILYTYVLPIYILHNFYMKNMTIFFYSIVFILNPYLSTLFLIRLIEYSLLEHKEIFLLPLIFQLFCNIIFMRKEIFKNFNNIFFMTILIKYNIFAIVLQSESIWDFTIMQFFFFSNITSSMIIFIFLFFVQKSLYKFNIPNFIEYNKDLSMENKVLIISGFFFLIVFIHFALRNSPIFYSALFFDYRETKKLIQIIVSYNYYLIFAILIYVYFDKLKIIL